MTTISKKGSSQIRHEASNFSLIRLFLNKTIPSFSKQKTNNKMPSYFKPRNNGETFECTRFESFPNEVMKLIFHQIWYTDKKSLLNCRLVCKRLKVCVDQFLPDVLTYPNRVLAFATSDSIESKNVLFWRAHRPIEVQIKSVQTLIKLANVNSKIVDLYLEGSDTDNAELLTTFLLSTFLFSDTNIRIFTNSPDFIFQIPLNRLIGTAANWHFWVLAPLNSSSKLIHTFQFENTSIMINFYGVKKYAKVVKYIKDALNQKPEKEAKDFTSFYFFQKIRIDTFFIKTFKPLISRVSMITDTEDIVIYRL